MIVEDLTIVRAGLVAIVGAEDDLEVVGEAGDGAPALALAERVRPDVALMDIHMPNMDGLAATAALVSSANPPKVIVLTSLGFDRYLLAALRSGASAFLLKDTEPERLVEAIRVVAAGEALLEPEAIRRLIEAFNSAVPDDSLLVRLTPREREVLLHIARGLTNAEIADTLGLKTSTVKDHVNALLGKIGARDRVQATIFAYDAGLVRAGHH